MELGPLTRSYSTFILLSSLSYINIVLSSLRGYLDSQAKYKASVVSPDTWCSHVYFVRASTCMASTPEAQQSEEVEQTNLEKLARTSTFTVQQPTNLPLIGQGKLKILHT